jgi:acyl carrier protein
MKRIERGVPEAGTQERIRRIFHEALNVEVPSAETDLFETGALDSLGFVELLVRLEQELGTSIAIEELDLADFRSIERMAAFLDRENREGREGGTA